MARRYHGRAFYIWRGGRVIRLAVVSLAWGKPRNSFPLEMLPADIQPTWQGRGWIPIHSLIRTYVSLFLLSPH